MGYDSVYCDSQDDPGKLVLSGIYFCKMTIKNFAAIKKTCTNSQTFFDPKSVAVDLRANGSFFIIPAPILSPNTE